MVVMFAASVVKYFPLPESPMDLSSSKVRHDIREDIAGVPGDLSLPGRSALQGLDDNRPVAVAGPADSVAAGEIGLARVRSLGEQGVDDFEVAAAGGDHQRCHAVPVDRIGR